MATDARIAEAQIPLLISRSWNISAKIADSGGNESIRQGRATTTISWITEYDLAEEDWARIRTALEIAIKHKESGKPGYLPDLPLLFNSALIL